MSPPEPPSPPSAAPEPSPTGTGRAARNLVEPAGERPAILLTGAGKRYDIVSCFARLTKTIVADPNPLAPAQYAAHVRVAVPLIEDPEYVPALERICAEHGVGARAAADRPRHRDARPGPRRRAAARARALAGDCTGDV